MTKCRYSKVYVDMWPKCDRDRIMEFRGLNRDGYVKVACRRRAGSLGSPPRLFHPAYIDIIPDSADDSNGQQPHRSERS